MRKSLLTLLCSAALCSAANAAVAADVMRVDGERSLAPEKSAAERSVRLAAYPQDATARVPLQPLAQKRVDALIAGNAKGGLRPMMVGVHRDVHADAAGDASATLQWVPTSDGGLVARLAVSSPGAKALRSALNIVAIPDGAELRFLERPSSTTVVGIATASEIARMHREDPLYWSPVTTGDEQAIEFYLPAGATPQQLRYTLDAVSHLLLSPEQMLAGEKVGESDPCQNDVRCVTNPSAAYTSAKEAVARMVFQVSGGSAVCTGTLLNDTVTTSQIPYFFSANHCISSQGVANSLTTIWFEEATACGSGVRASGFTQVGGGATVLFNSSATDSLLLRLNNAAPAGAVYGGWDGNPIGAGTNILVLHHPSGDVKKVSLGQVKGFTPYPGEGGSYVNVGYTNGSTEGGSSGSGLLTLANDQYYLRGGLYGGAAGCSNTGSVNNSGNDDYFSRFDLVLPNIRQFLSPAATSGPRITEGMSGIWSDPSVPGQGFTFEANAATGLFAIGWFTWSTNTGEYLWYSGAGNFSGNSTTVTLQRTRGGRFATPTSVTTTGAGTITITFTACDRATANYSLTDPTLSGTINLARLLPASSLCTAAPAQ